MFAYDRGIGWNRLVHLATAVSQTTLFLIMRNASIRETDTLGDALRSIVELLPASWRFDERREVVLRGVRLDAVVELVGPSGDRAAFAVEAKLSGSV